MESAKGEIRGMSDRRSDRFDTGLADRSDADLEGGEQLRQVQGSSLDLMGAGSAGLGKRRISLAALARTRDSSPGGLAESAFFPKKSALRITSQRLKRRLLAPARPANPG